VIDAAKSIPWSEAVDNSTELIKALQTYQKTDGE
jgi:hypothetical protein